MTISPWKKTRITLSFFLTIFSVMFPTLVAADITRRVTADFRPMSGVIIMPLKDEFLIDLGRHNGVVRGDLFTVVVPGEQVIHPHTKEVLGSLDEVASILKITSVNDRFSHAQALSGSQDLEPGDTLGRFMNVPAVFKGSREYGPALFDDLRSTLPHLDWWHPEYGQFEWPPNPQQLNKDETPMLFFIQEAGILNVYDNNFQPLRNYDTISESGFSSPSGPKTETLEETTVTKSNSIVVHNTNVDSSQIWTAQELKGNPVALEIGDLDGDGYQEHATLYRDKLKISRLVSGETQILSTFPLEWADKFLTMDSIDLNSDGISELYITAVDEHGLASLVFGFSQDRFQLLQHSIPFYLRKVHIAGEGDVLLGQQMGESRTHFSYPVYRLSLSNNKLEPGEPIQLPWGAEIFGITSILDNKETPLFVTLSGTGQLQVKHIDGTKLWESAKPFGGSHLNFSRRDHSGGTRAEVLSVYIKPRLEKLDDNTILVPLNEGGGMFNFFTDRGPGRVVAMQWNGQYLQQLWHTQPQNGYLADFRYADFDNDGTKELVKLIHFSRSGFLKEGRSALIVYEID